MIQRYGFFFLYLKRYFTIPGVKGKINFTVVNSASMTENGIWVMGIVVHLMWFKIRSGVS